MHISSIRDLAAAVRGRRQELDLSQAELATRAGVSRAWVNYVEAGKPTAEVGLVIRLLDALGLRLDLVEGGRDGDPSSPPVDLDAVLDEYRDR